MLNKDSVREKCNNIFLPSPTRITSAIPKTGDKDHCARMIME